MPPHNKQRRNNFKDMIKKIIGTLFTLATMAIIVATIWASGTYTSLLPENLFGSSLSNTPTVTAPAEPMAEEAATAELPTDADEADIQSEVNIESEANIESGAEQTPATDVQ